MKKTILYILAILLVSSFCLSTQTLASSQAAIQLWLTTLVPSFLFPLILVRLLAPYHLLYPLLKPFKKIIWFIFRIDLSAFELILTSLFLGFPSASIFLDEFLKQSKITKHQYQRIMYCTFLASPNFILISLRTIYPQTIVVTLLMVQLLCIATLLLCTRKTALCFSTQHTHVAFFDQLRTSIFKSFEILLIILAYLLIVYVVIDILCLPLWESAKIPLKLLAEFSSGCFYIHTLAIPTFYQYVFTSILLSYGGLCVHMQISSALSKSSFHYFSFIKFRILHILLSILFTYFLLM